jgi:hypothetical protein
VHARDPAVPGKAQVAAHPAPDGRGTPLVWEREEHLLALVVAVEQVRLAAAISGELLLELGRGGRMGAGKWPGDRHEAILSIRPPSGNITGL